MFIYYYYYYYYFAWHTMCQGKRRNISEVKNVEKENGLASSFLMLFIKKKTPSLNTQSDSIRAKLFV